MLRAIPTCKTCGFQHYNVIQCDQAAVQRLVTDEDNRRERNRRQPLLRRRANDFGDRLKNTVNIADGVVGLKRKPIHSMPKQWTD